GRTVFKDFQSIEGGFISIKRKALFFLIFKTNQQIGLFNQPDAEILVNFPGELVSAGSCCYTPEPEVKFIVDYQLTFLHYKRKSWDLASIGQDQKSLTILP